jgi:hypothetical protein
LQALLHVVEHESATPAAADAADWINEAAAR